MLLALQNHLLRPFARCSRGSSQRICATVGAREHDRALQRRAFAALSVFTLLSISQLGQAATYVLKDQDLRWSVMRTINGGPTEFLFTGPQVGQSGGLQVRSVLDFDLRDLPDTEKVVSAKVILTPSRFTIVGQFSVGDIRHLDATRPPRIANQLVDPFRFGFDDLPSAPVVTGLNLGLDGNYDVTTAVAADHLSGFTTSPLGLMNNPTRFVNNAVVEYSGFITAPQLVVETAAPEALSFALESLGSNRYKATYSVRNEISLLLGLLDIEFDPALYREDTLQVSLEGDAATDWTAEILDSGFDVPAVVTLINNGAGLRGGQRASGFQVEFDWLGAGLPGAQGYTVFDSVNFETLYTGVAAATTPVPLPMPIWSLLSGLVLLGSATVKRLSKRSDAR